MDPQTVAPSVQVSSYPPCPSETWVPVWMVRRCRSGRARQPPQLAKAVPEDAVLVEQLLRAGRQVHRVAALAALFVEGGGVDEDGGLDRLGHARPRVAVPGDIVHLDGGAGAQVRGPDAAEVQ